MKFILALLFVLIYKVNLAQDNYYYYKGQTKSIQYSNRIMFIKFVENLSDYDRSAILSNQNLTILGASLNNIPDLVKVQSRVLTAKYIYYPCGDPSIAKINKFEDTVLSRPAPCLGCPDCTPITTYITYNNFDSAITALKSNPNIKSISAAILNDVGYQITGTYNNIYIKIKQNHTINEFNSLFNLYNLTKEDVSLTMGNDVYKITVPNIYTRDILTISNQFFITNNCDFATPDFCYTKLGYSNDPLYPNQWGLKNTGQGPGIAGTVGNDIRIEPAWQYTKGANVKVAVLDCGVQLNHPDLQPNLLLGYDATSQNTNGGPFSPNDENNYAHGTLVAGIIGAVGDNGIGITGVAPQCKIIPINIEKRYNEKYYSDAAKGIIWAYKTGQADILNCSWGGGTQSDLIDNAILEAATLGRMGKGCTIIFSGGQTDFSNYSLPVAYPANNTNVISVGGWSQCNQRLFAYGDPLVTSSCNTGITNSFFGENLKMAAPGSNISSTSSNSNYVDNFGGTSASAPFVSGIAALVLSINPNLTKFEVQRILEYSCNKAGQYCYSWTSNHPNGPWTSEAGYGRINASNAVQLALKATSFSTPVLNVPSTSNTLISNTAFQLQIASAACTVTGAGAYFFRRIEVSTNISFPFTINPLIICNSNGWSAANPNNAQNYAVATNVTNTSATLKTYVYQGFNVLGQNIGIIPAYPQNIKFNYSVIGANSPVILENLKNSSNNVSNDKSNKINFDFDEHFIYNDLEIKLPELAKSYPNPANKILDIKISIEDERIEILNSTGQLQLSMNLKKLQKNYTKNINIEALKPGIYYLNIIGYNSKKSTTFIKL